MIIYKCKKPGHVKYDCPLYKAKRQKRKTMVPTWSQSEGSSDDKNENEVANICFMDFEDKDELNSNPDENEDFTFEYDDLLKAIYNLDEKNTSLKKKLFELQNELDEIKGKFSKIEASKMSLEKENKELLKKNEWLVSSISNYHVDKRPLTLS